MSGGQPEYMGLSIHVGATLISNYLVGMPAMYYKLRCVPGVSKLIRIRSCVAYLGHLEGALRSPLK